MFSLLRRYWLVLLTLAAGASFLFFAGSAYALFIDVFSNGSNAFNADTLNQPTSLTASGGSAITLNWMATADTYASGHRVFRSTTTGGPYSQIAEVTPRTTTTYTDNPASGTYFYVARAFHQNWESANSNEASATVSSSVTVSFGASVDSYVRDDQTGNNFGTNTQMHVRGAGSPLKRAFVQFNVSTILAGSTINSATLTLCLDEVPAASAQGKVHELRRVNGSWTETGLTWNNQPAISSTVTGTIVVPSTATCVTFNVTSDVQAWVNGTTNNGWRLNEQNEGSGGGNAKYATRENGSSSTRPKLDVTYAPP